MKKKFMILIVILMIMAPGITFANDAKDYIPAPAGTTAVLFYFDHISGSDAFADGNKVSRNADLTGNVAIFRTAYWNQIGPFPWAVTFLLPYGELALDNVGTNPNRISHSGIGDPIFAGFIWPVNKPSTRTWLGFGQYIIAPWGEYDNTKPPALQLATNQWKFREELNFTQGLGSLPLMLDLSGYVQFYTDNDKYGPNNLTQSQDPLWHAEAHIIWDVNKSWFLSGDYFYNNGAESTVAGVDLNDKTIEHKVGLTVGYMINPTTQILLKGQEVVKTENGIRSTDIGVRFAFFW